MYNRYDYRRATTEDRADMVANDVLKILKDINANAMKVDNYTDHTDIKVTVYTDDVTLDEMTIALDNIEKAMKEADADNFNSYETDELIELENDYISITIDIEEVI
jgi:hypothetical protein